ncbi:Extracellular phospholipase A1 (fragment) [Serratia proteamaculans]
MSMSLSFTSAVSSAAIQPPVARVLPEPPSSLQLTETLPTKTPTVTLSTNSLNTLATGTVAVTFNAAGVSDYTLNRMGIGPAAAKQDAQAGGIRRYSEQYDMLTGIDDRRPSKHVDRSLTAHGIDKVIGSMAEQNPWEAKANA